MFEQSDVIRTATRLNPAWSDPDAIVSLIRSAGPLSPLANYAANDAEMATLSTQENSFTPPWFRQDFVRGGEVLVDEDREYVIYESSWSDIIGVMLFNAVLLAVATGGRGATINFFAGGLAVLVMGALIGLADQIIDGVDLPAIIRESTGTVTAEVITDVRTQTARADDVVSGFVDRVLGRSPQGPE